METVNSIQKLLDQGKDPKEVFTYVEDKNENNILCVCLHNEMWNLLKIPENKLVCFKWYYRILEFEDGFAKVENDWHEWNLLNSDGKEVCYEWYDSIGIFSNGFARVRKGNYYNFLKKDGTILCKNWYDLVKDFNNDFAKVLSDDGWKYIDITGNIINTK